MNVLLLVSATSTALDGRIFAIQLTVYYSLVCNTSCTVLAFLTVAIDAVNSSLVVWKENVIRRMFVCANEMKVSDSIRFSHDTVAVLSLT